MIAMFMIVYDHLCALRNPDYVITEMMDGIVNRPLVLVQSFGALGVSIFFIISGFLLSAASDDGAVYLYRKFVRIWLPLITTLGLFYLFNRCVSLIGGETYWDQFLLSDWIDCPFLVCYLKGTDTFINGAIWYLFPLLTLYMLYALLLKIVKKNNLMFVIAVDTIFIVLIVGKHMGLSPIKQMQWLVFLLIPMFGMIIRALYDKKVSINTFMLLMLIQYIMLVAGIQNFRGEYYTDQPYINSCIYALMIVGIGLLSEQYLSLPRIVSWMSEISYDVYLMHMTFGALIMTILEYLKFNFTISLLMGILGSFAVAWLHYEKVERHISKMLLRKL